MLAHAIAAHIKKSGLFSKAALIYRLRIDRDLYAFNQLLDACFFELHHNTARASGIFPDNGAGVLERFVTYYLTDQKGIADAVVFGLIATFGLFGSNQVLTRKAGSFMAF
jgi:hypothetical protein